MITHVACLYSVVLGPERRLKSADLLEVAAAADLAEARTVLSTGNLVFAARGAEHELEWRLEQAVARAFGRLIPVFVRTAQDWWTMVAGNPFPAETAADPAQVAVRILRQPMPAAVLSRIAQRRAPGEQVELAGRALWLAAAGQLSTSPLFRAAGADWAGEGTFRNASAAARIAAALD